MDRREFLMKSGTLAATLPLVSTTGMILSGCNGKISPDELFHEETKTSFPLLEIKGDYYDIGYAIGTTFKEQITGMFEDRSGYMNKMKSYIHDHPDLYDGMMAASKEYYPHLIKEMEGIANGSGIALRDIFIMNIKAEIGAAMTLENNDTPGCSTIYSIGPDEMFYVHNEDGNESNNGKMFMVKATPPSGVSFYVMTYPGILMGNGPAMNNQGITQSTNYIASLEYKIGIPRYVVGRAVLESKSLDEAISIATNPKRAFAYHHNLGSFNEQRIISLEVTPSDYMINEPTGIYCHTNHLILENTSECTQDSSYINSSSLSRYVVLEREIANIDQQSIAHDDALAMLSSHEQKPYSPCRHPQGNVNGRTLGTGLFDIKNREMIIYKGNPCIAAEEGKFEIYKF